MKQAAKETGLKTGMAIPTLAVDEVVEVMTFPGLAGSARVAFGDRIDAPRQERGRDIW